jgi:2-polyprenyl-6-methoxyphenol hydroxylase-like FAD-dependent oxidoreductase
MKVIIAGAGLGGLCLAHGLRQAGVEAQVLERRPSPADQPASYGIHLNGPGLRSLRACLPAANWERLDGTAVPAPDVVRFWDQRLRTLAVIDHEVPGAGRELHRRAVSRGALRDVLLHGLNTRTANAADVVQWGRAVTGYDHDPGGRLRVRCADGGEVTGDLLVGADGSNSRIRAQRLPGLNRLELGILNIAGRVPLTPQVAGQLPAALTDGSVNNIVPAGPGWMFVSTWRIDAVPKSLDGTGLDGTDLDGTGLDGTDLDSGAAGFFLVWAWAADRASYPADVDAFTPERLRDLVAGRVAGWAPALRGLVAATDPGTVAPVWLRSMPALAAWPASDVTLLGDAIHNMTPMAGIGANTALRDADGLRQALLAPGPDDVTVRVGRYEEQMRGYANQALALSTRNARNAASTRRLPRLAFRSALRIAESVPPAKRRMFGGTPAPVTR